MSQKIMVGPISKGLRNDVLPFNIDNDSFPKLINAYQWRGRLKRKRGTTQLGRLQRTLTAQALGNTDGSGTFLGNIFTILGISTSQPNAAVIHSSVTITVGAQSFTDNGSGVLSNGAGGTGTIIYSSGLLTFQTDPILATTAVTIQFTYYPSLPVMGLEELILNQTEETLQLGFDTIYSYNIPISFPFTPYSVSFYKNPPTDAPYTQKTTATPLIWNGQDYQQFWTANYQGALWATNGIEEPFDITNIGMQFKLIQSATQVSATDVDFVTTNNHPFVAGDFIFVNQVDVLTGMNYQTGYVLAAPAPTATTFRAQFPNATIGAGPATTGIIQALTTSCLPDVSSTTPTNTKDCIRWYDGDPTTGSAPFLPTPGKGWVNFCPPLNNFSTNSIYSLSDLTPAQYYLVGARMIVPYKDRLLFLGPVVQTSTNPPVYLPDTIIYSQNGVPFYTASFGYTTVNFTPTPTIAYNPLLVPTNQSAQPISFWGDQPGFGGFIQSGTASPITTIGSNEDVLIVGFKKRQTRLIYTGNDIVPFNFYTINTELGSEATFSSINLDRGVITVGGRGIIITSQTASQRIDLEIPDQLFQFNLKNNGPQRICSQRDYINEWIYFTFRSNQNNEDNYIFPTQTLFYNYRDHSWAIFNETYTTYGTFRRFTGQFWDSLTEFIWDEWDDIWDSGEQTLLQPEVIAGNGQGFIMFLAEGTGEDPSGYIQAIDSSSVVTSPNHCLNEGDYIIISGCLGTISSQINDNIYSVANPTQNTFTLNPTIESPGTYLGDGVFTRLYVPQIQSKQFPTAWEMQRKTRIGVQQYLLTKPSINNSQITLQIFLSQDSQVPYNFGSVVPAQSPGSINNALIYSDILYTCPESTNLALTPANTNLQELNLIDSDGASLNRQQQIWHRMNTSLIGDTVQIGFTLSDAQMRAVDDDGNPISQFAEIEIHAFNLTVSPSQLLS